MTEKPERDHFFICPCCETRRNLRFAQTCLTCGDKSLPVGDPESGVSLQPGELPSHRPPEGLEASMALTAKVLGANGSFQPQDMAAIEDFVSSTFGTSPDTQEHALAILRRSLRNPPPLSGLLTRLIGLDLEAKRRLLAFLAKLSGVDPTQSSPGSLLVRELRHMLLPEEDPAPFPVDPSLPLVQQYLCTLGLTHPFSRSELEAAFQRKCQDLSTADRLHLPNRFREFARGELEKIREAYEYLAHTCP